MQGIDQRSETFSPALDSCSKARALVREGFRTTDLADSGIEDSAVLLTSELVTNAILHAKTKVLVSVATSNHGVHIEVTDFIPDLPIPKIYSESATTGRGLHLVEKLATTWGTVRGKDSKTIWFDIFDDGLKEPPVFVSDFDTPTAEHHTLDYPALDLVEVTLIDLPVNLYRKLFEYLDSASREIALISHGSNPVSAKLKSVKAKIQNLSTTKQAADMVLADALLKGTTKVTLSYSVPRNIHGLVLEASSLFDDIDEQCSSGSTFLTIEPSFELTSFRKWLVNEVLCQLQGSKPSPFYSE